LAEAKTKKVPSSRSTKIASPIKVRTRNCLSLTRLSRHLHCVSILSRGGWRRPLTAAPLQAQALIGQNGEPCRSGKHPCDDATNFRQFTEFVGGKRLQDTSRLPDRNTFNLRVISAFARETLAIPLDGIHSSGVAKPTNKWLSWNNQRQRCAVLE